MEVLTMEDKCTKCGRQAYTAGLCRKHYREEFEKNKKGLGERFDLT